MTKLTRISFIKKKSKQERRVNDFGRDTNVTETDQKTKHGKYEQPVATSYRRERRPHTLKHTAPTASDKPTYHHLPQESHPELANSPKMSLTGNTRKVPQPMMSSFGEGSQRLLPPTHQPGTVLIRAVRPVENTSSRETSTKQVRKPEAKLMSFHCAETRPTPAQLNHRKEPTPHRRAHTTLQRRNTIQERTDAGRGVTITHALPRDHNKSELRPTLRRTKRVSTGDHRKRTKKKEIDQRFTNLRLELCTETSATATRHARRERTRRETLQRFTHRRLEDNSTEAGKKPSDRDPDMSTGTGHDERRARPPNLNRRASGEHNLHRRSEKHRNNKEKKKRQGEKHTEGLRQPPKGCGGAGDSEKQWENPRKRLERKEEERETGMVT
ncbi:hypothetical protein YC2023_062983 [Brassica napus]